MYFSKLHLFTKLFMNENNNLQVLIYYKLQAAPKDRYGVDITPMTYIPGAKIERYLGNLNFFFIRESTCIREV